MIPPITDPMGANWRQPDHSAWLFDDTHVVLPQRDFDRLGEYSTTYPTGVYEGKVWRAQPPQTGVWVVRWYGFCADPTRCSNNQRIALVVP